MIDIHTHLLYGIDDGAATRELSLRQLDEYQRAGFTHLVCTPHIYNPYVTTNIGAIRDVYSDFEAEAKKRGIRTYLGSELFLRTQSNIKSIAFGGHYCLVEFDVYSKLIGLLDRLDTSLVYEKGYEIIIAHVERYQWLEPTDPMVQDMKRRGYYFQMNVEDINLEKGQKWLETGLIDFFGTDNHARSTGLPSMLAEAVSKYPDIAAQMKILENSIS